MIEVICLVLGIAIGVGLSWLHMRETTSVANDIIKGYRSDLSTALDRIQAPSLEEFKVQTREPDHVTPVLTYFDETGLVEEQIEDDRGER